MKDKLLTLGGFDRAKVWIEAALQDLQRTLAKHDVHVYRELTGTAAVTASPYTHAKWDVVDESVTEYRDGMIVCVKVPVAGNGTYGTGLQINSLGYKPVVYNVNSMVSTRYSVGSVVWAVYNATQTASLYIDSTAAVTVTGCWQVQDYDANTDTIGYQLRTNSSTRPVSSATYRYRLMFSSLDNSQWVPANNSTSTNATSARTVNQEVINPWGRIVYYSTTTARTAGQSLSTSAQWDRYILDLGYSFNDGSELDLTFPGPVYIKCTPQANGGAIIDSTTPYTQTLPSTADGKIYIYLGQAYSASEVELIDYHPVYYHDGTKIALWTDRKGGGGGADWAENDSTASGYIAHRTHWEEDPTFVNYNILELNVTTSANTANGVRCIHVQGIDGAYYFDFLDVFNVPEMIVSVNGHEFNVNVYDNYGWGYYGISNLYAEGQESGVVLESDMCWVNTYYQYEMDREQLYIYVPDSVVGQGINSLVIKILQSGVHQIPEKFIPYKQADWEQSDNTAPDYIKNKPDFVSNIINEYGYFTSEGLYLSENVIESMYYDTNGYTSDYFYLYAPNGVTRLAGYCDINYLSGIYYEDFYLQSITLSEGIYRCRLIDGLFEYKLIINYDFTHTSNATVSGSTTTVTFVANQRGSAMLTISADLGLSIACNNSSDNYIWIKNTGSAEVDVTISAVTKNSMAVSNVYVPSDGITVPAGGLCEIGVIVNTDGAFITSRKDLAL